MPALAYEGAFPIPNNKGRDIGPNLRLTRDADGDVKLATNGTTDLQTQAGLSTAQFYGSVDEVVSCEPLVAGKVYRVVAAGAFSAYATLYPATNGRVDDTVSGVQWGIALEAAVAAGDEVLAQYLPKRVAS